MQKTSRFSNVLPSQLKQIAERIKHEMHRLRLNEVQLAGQCSLLSQELFADDEQPQFSRERIAKILMNLKRSPGKSAARALSSQEITILSRVFEVSSDWLIGRQHTGDPVLWHPLADAQRAEQVVNLLSYYEEKTGESFIWSNFLVCSLTTSEFMHAYHEAIFEEFEILGLREEKRKVVELFDRIGNQRRRRLLAFGGDRPYEFTQLILHSDLKKIALGVDECASISRRVRFDCLRNLRRLIADRELQLNLVVAIDEEVPNFKSAMRNYSALGMMAREFAMWDYCSGKIVWSENRAYITPYRKLLDEARDRATFRTPAMVGKLLESFCDEI
jgi:hypothetical protein